ncbi:hypothetical protein BRN33_24240 [Xanthomonas oryzae pv. oryzae]|nr:hypothetical protein BRL93_08010 [Xanthomonas oryzae pv. oryzae]RBL06399.1 hypothetical protein BRN33_24240 [Xanthomonas oryzae pv. oryzae]RBL28084.1 hypothetical protein BRN31_16265 [Xanthomonas oryzae pv. oryzae]RBL59691.1 hypothetical protein BRN24_13985 [Xanthomonas oryzae pv. oryzae]
MTWATPFGSEVAQVRSPGSLHNRWCCDPELKPPTPKTKVAHLGCALIYSNSYFSRLFLISTHFQR